MKDNFFTEFCCSLSNLDMRELKQGPCISIEGWDGEGDGREVQEGGDMYNLWLIHVENKFMLV